MGSHKCCSSCPEKECKERPTTPVDLDDGHTSHNHHHGRCDTSSGSGHTSHNHHYHENSHAGCGSASGCGHRDATAGQMENHESTARAISEKPSTPCCSLDDNLCSCDENCLLQYAAVLCRSRCDDSNSDTGSEDHCCNINGATRSSPEINWTSKSQHASHHGNEAHHHHHGHGHGHGHGNDHCHDNGHSHRSYISRQTEALTCTKCYTFAKNAALNITSVSGNLVKKCYCALVRELKKNMKNPAPALWEKSRISLASSAECCPIRIHGAASSCCSLHSHGHHGNHNDSREEVSITVEEDLPPRFLSLGVTGMTCTGCADKVVYALKSTNGVQKTSVNVNFLMGRADLNFLPDFIDENEILEKIKRSTGFRVVVLNSGDIQDAGLAKAWISVGSIGNQHQTVEGINGIANVKLLESAKGRQLFEVGYDPTIIGVRDLLATLNDGDHGIEAQIVEMPSEETITADLEKSHMKSLGWKTVSAAVLTIPVLIFAWAPLNTPHPSAHVIQVSLATAVMGMAHNIYQSAWGTMLRGGAGGQRIDMDVLITVATGSAWAASVAIMIVTGLHKNPRSKGEFAEPFFETCCLLVTLILTGRWVTAKVRMWAMKRVVDVGEETDQISPTAMLLVEGDTTPQATSTSSLQYGDILVVEKGKIIATDGVVLDGEAEVDESLLTGESRPAVMRTGSLVMAGSTVVSGSIRFRLTRLPHENTISVIRRMVRSAGGEKPKIQEIADKLALYLTPVILGVAGAVFLIWMLINGLTLHRNWGNSAVDAVTYAVATLAVSCPCAIGLVVPMVLVFTSRVGIRKCGFLLVNPKALERGWKAKKVVFDKTGTLTSGKLKVVSAKYVLDGKWSDGVDAEIEQLVRNLCRDEKHPVARALAASIDAGEDTPDLMVEAVIGMGLQAVSGIHTVRGGQPSWATPGGEIHPMVSEVVKQGFSVFAVSVDHTLRAVFGLEDTIRPEAAAVIAELHRRKIEAYIFSGDHGEAVKKIATDLGLPDQNYKYSCSPEKKSSEIKALQQSSPGSVLFLGDGTNDAVALTQADVGFSFGDSTEVAVSASDIAVLSTSLNSVIDFLDLSIRVKRCILASFSWAILWNLFAVLAAAGAFVKFRIEPQWAGLGELGSVLPVVLIAAMVGIGWHKISKS